MLGCCIDADTQDSKKEKKEKKKNEQKKIEEIASESFRICFDRVDSCF